MKTTTPAALFLALSTLAPSIAFSVSRDLDSSYRWDGDGPDPILEGFDAYDVTVKASAIVGGKMVEGVDYLGGSYFKPDEETGDLHGYLAQMLVEALDGLEQEVKSESLTREIVNARAYMRGLMQREYDAQREEIAKRA